MGDSKTIAVRLDDMLIKKLDEIVEITGWNQSEVIRRLIENAAVYPPAVITDTNGSAKKAFALTADLMGSRVIA